MPRRLIGVSPSSSLSALLQRVLFFGSRSVSSRGITTDRKVLAPRDGDATVDTSWPKGGFCGLALLDLRKRTLVRRLQVLDASMWMSPLTVSWSGMYPLQTFTGTEVDVFVFSASSMGVPSERGATGLREGGSELLGEVSCWNGKVNSSNVGGGSGYAGASGGGFSSDWVGVGTRSKVMGGGGGGRAFFKLISLRTSIIVFLSSLSLLLRDGLFFIAVLRSSFSRSSFSWSSSGVSWR